MLKVSVAANLEVVANVIRVSQGLLLTEDEGDSGREEHEARHRRWPCLINRRGGSSSSSTFLWSPILVGSRMACDAIMSVAHFLVSKRRRLRQATAATAATS